MALVAATHILKRHIQKNLQRAFIIKKQDLLNFVMLLGLPIWKFKNDTRTYSFIKLIKVMEKITQNTITITQ